MTTLERNPNWCAFSKQTFQCNNYLVNIQIQAMKSCLWDLCAWIFKMLRRALFKGFCAILWACLRGWIRLKGILSMIGGGCFWRMKVSVLVVVKWYNQYLVVDVLLVPLNYFSSIWSWHHIIFISSKLEAGKDFGGETEPNPTWTAI